VVVSQKSVDLAGVIPVAVSWDFMPRQAEKRVHLMGAERSAASGNGEGTAAARSASSSASSCAEPTYCPMSCVPRRNEYTTWTAVAPEPVLTGLHARTPGSLRPQVSAQIACHAARTLGQGDELVANPQSLAR
jgi:hypothetical protein